MIDVSSYQGYIDWRKVHDQGGVRHAYIKLTEGAGYLDKLAARNVAEARKHGINIGLYHYAGDSVSKTLHSPLAEVRFFLRNAAPFLKSGDLPPALDLEETYGHTYAALNDWKAQWFAAVDAHTGIRSVFYSYYYFWKQMTLYHDRPVWGAALGSAFKPPPTWAIQQFSFTGSCAGISGHVDLDRILHDVKMLP